MPLAHGPESGRRTAVSLGGDVDVMERARQLLREVYGYAEFLGRQQDIIAHVLAGGDALVLMPTGGGKSLCYQLPAMLRPGVGLIVSPLIALMQDQVTALRQLGVRAAFLNSTLPYMEQRAVLAEALDGRLDLLYLAPERLLKEETLTALADARIALIAIDEAHCVSQWGHDFRQDYLGLNALATHFPGVPRLALTATADAATREEILTRLALADAMRFVSGFDRPNIRYTVRAKTEPREQLVAFLESQQDNAGIVYAMTRKRVDETAAMLRERGFDALPYHAGLGAAERAKHQARFLREDGVIIVATIAFGMGIDKPDARFVAHIDLPKSVEAYYQETGRAGRDGAPAEAWMIYGLQDVARLAQLLDQSEAGEQHKRVERARLDALLGWCELTTCRRRALLAHFGDAPTEDCGNCDTCLDPPLTWDGTVDAQKLLSCVYRTGQFFGAGHIIDVLRGKETAKARQHRHGRLSTFGIGAELSDRQWRSVLRQLLVRGYLKTDAARYGALSLTPKARPVLRGEERVHLREDAAPKRPAKVARKPSAAPQDTPPQLWEALRETRRRLAEDANVPPYVIFHDATLHDMARVMPTSPEALLQLHGVGQAKLERYGDAFLDVLRRFREGEVAGVAVDGRDVEPANPLLGSGLGL